MTCPGFIDYDPRHDIMDDTADVSCRVVYPDAIGDISYERVVILSPTKKDVSTGTGDLHKILVSQDLSHLANMLGDLYPTSYDHRGVRSLAGVGR